MTDTPTAVLGKLAGLLAAKRILRVERRGKQLKLRVPLLALNLDRGCSGRSDLYSPLGSLHVHRQYDWEPAWFIGRGRIQELEIRVPLPRGWAFEINSRGKSYRELVGAPKYLENLNWMIDEFDASFNDYAIASLRYHLDFSVCDNSTYREQFEDLIDRLGECGPRFTGEELAILHPPGWTIDDDFERLEGGGARLRSSSPAQRAVYDAYRERERAYHARKQQARHDFVDIIPHLWS